MEGDIHESISGTLLKNKLTCDPFYGLENEAIIDIVDTEGILYDFVIHKIPISTYVGIWNYIVVEFVNFNSLVHIRNLYQHLQLNRVAHEVDHSKFNKIYGLQLQVQSPIRFMDSTYKFFCAMQ